MRNKVRAKSLGEVFTPQFLVEHILSHIPKKILLNPKKIVLDSSCGNGQFLVEVMKRRRMKGFSHEKVLANIYGIDLDELNIKETRDRLLDGSMDKKLAAIVNHNIICANTLDPFHKGWEAVGGYMWGGHTNLLGFNVFKGNR
ncbi:MAG: N-6 DNA methylase [Tissierellales bacterium]|nr:N-6 DNA methylase [Tissierellales bacterium]